MKVGASVGADFEPASIGVHDAVLAEIADLGTESHPKFGVRHQGMFVFQIAETMEIELGGKTVVKRKEIRGYFDAGNGLGKTRHKKGPKLRQYLEGWRGRKFTEEDLMKFVPEDQGGGGKELDLDPLIGKSCQVVVEAATSEQGRDYAKLVSVLPQAKRKEDRIGLSETFPYTPVDERGQGGDSGSNSVGSQPSNREPEEEDDLPWAL